MKAFFITTQSGEMPQYVESFTSLGFQAERFAFNHHKDSPGTAQEYEPIIWDQVSEYQPDLIVYVGACESNTPSPQFLRRLRDKAPTVHLCPDAGDHPWWPEIMAFDEALSFDVQVAMDGSPWPLENTQITGLMAFNPDRYHPIPHENRPVLFGFAGDIGGPREELLNKLKTFGLQCRNRDNDNYEKVANYICNCRMVPNIGRTGSFDRMHVKWRVMESGLSEALLLEMKGSPTSKWFIPGVDYMEWETPQEAGAIVQFYRDKPEETQVFGKRLRKKVLENHSPQKFWGRVFEKL